MIKNITPMMQQYLSIKEQHKNAVLFFRLGDFYEMFNEDALEVSALLNLTLTRRAGNPMCGIPFHASKSYIARLLRAGKKIAVCEQVSAPVAGELTERKVVEIITPGTATADDFLEQGQNNYLAALYCTPKKIPHDGRTDFFIGFAYIDVSTGEFFALSFPATSFEEDIKKELSRIQPKELLIQHSIYETFPVAHAIFEEYPNMLKNTYPDWHYNLITAEKKLCTCFGTESLQSFSLNRMSPEVPPAALLVEYFESTAGQSALTHITGIKVYKTSDFVIIDDAALKNLELVQNLRDHTAAYTLFETLNYTKTAMGARLLRHWLHHPLYKQTEISARLAKTARLYQDNATLKTVRTILAATSDIQRLIGKVAMNRVCGKDLLSLKNSLRAALDLHTLSNETSGFFLRLQDSSRVNIEKLFSFLDNTIAEDCPIAISDGGVIKQGWSEKLDELRNIQTNANQLLQNYLEKERAATGIQNLKIKYNKLMGYFLEVTRGNLDAIPKHFISRRSLTNVERFTTVDLTALEDKINTVALSLADFEKELFQNIIQTVQKKTELLSMLAKDISELDVLQSFAHAALVNTWTEPEFSDCGILDIQNGRHPVVEHHLPSGEFIPNSLRLSSNTSLDNAVPAFALITGPNMAGKSTFLRQTALIVLLAQIGSFVPADKAYITPVDRIFCRVGAADNLARGESTFLVEMTETAYILRNASPRSLVIMDEVGRGTATSDGLSIAQAVSEYLLNNIKAKTLFATHYHELTDIKHPKLKNFCLEVLESNGKVVFLKKVIEGAAEHSYGIHVAKLAGLPEPVLQRAKALFHSHPKSEAPLKTSCPSSVKPPTFKSENMLFQKEELIINELLSIKADSITPLQALQIITRWKNILR